MTNREAHGLGHRPGATPELIASNKAVMPRHRHLWLRPIDVASRHGSEQPACRSDTPVLRNGAKPFDARVPIRPIWHEIVAQRPDRPTISVKRPWARRSSAKISARI